MDNPFAVSFLSDARYVQGTLVKIGGVNEITQTDHYADPGVIGVVASTAMSDASLMVVAIGRAAVRVIGTARKGDSLVASEVLGVARSIGQLDASVESLEYVNSTIGRVLEHKLSDIEGLVGALIVPN